MSLIIIPILFVICLIMYRPKFTNFLLWLAICAAVYLFLSKASGFWGVLIYIAIWGYDGQETKQPSSPPIDESNGKPTKMYDRMYEDGTYRVKNISNTGYYYSNGIESWIGMLGEEHRSNGEIVRENAYIKGRRDIYTESDKYIGYEYDSLGITYRVNEPR